MQEQEEGKQLHIRLSSESFKKLRVRCINEDISLQDYVVHLIKQSLGEVQENKASLLIVEDETILRESLEDSLKDKHFVSSAETAEEAIELVKNRDFDILIVDVRLPKMNGLQLIKTIKDIKPYVKFIVVTAFPSVELAVEAMKQGAVDYLVKPVRVEDLEKLIGNIIKQQRSTKKEKEEPTLS